MTLASANHTYLSLYDQVKYDSYTCISYNDTIGCNYSYIYDIYNVSSLS